MLRPAPRSTCSGAPLHTILLINGGPELQEALTAGDGSDQFTVLTAHTDETAASLACRPGLAAVMLHTAVPTGRELALLAEITMLTPAPVIVISPAAEDRHAIDILEAGADHYLHGPVSPDRLRAHLRAALRRPVLTRRRPVIGDHVIDVETDTVTGPQGHVHLTRTEWKLLHALLARPGRLVTRETVMHEVWGAELDNGTALRVYLTSLRRKLERTPSQPRHLLTEARVGYRYQP
ncbi:winged helix-turn-helix domain-containing protein [Kitasatospora indigofera]|uniref:winged helix-turn-helix domain-containing protein n=1 Tax=Kitasatospora indigofera TaxID=67307 RepID=UPI0036412814